MHYFIALNNRLIIVNEPLSEKNIIDVKTLDNFADSLGVNNNDYNVY